MIGRSGVLRAIRRQRTSLGRVVLALFALVSFGSMATPCLAMSLAAAAAAHHSSDHAAAYSAESNMHSHAGHRHAMPEPATHSPSHCPHCPLSGSMPDHAPDALHAHCATADDTSDRAQPSASSLLLEHVLPPPLLELPPLGLFRPPPIAPGRVLAPTLSSVALNVRHCVFLI